MRSLIKGVLTTGTSALVNLLLWTLSIKIIAMMLGPSGVGLFSLIRQALLTFSSFGSAGQTAVVQGISSKNGDELKDYINNTFWLFIGGTFFSVLILALFSNQIAYFIFNQSDQIYITLIKWLTLPVILTNLYFYLKSVINGNLAIGRLAIVEVLGPLIAIVLVYPVSLVVKDGHVLAFIWFLSATQFVMIMASVYLILRSSWLKGSALMKFKYRKASCQHFFKITGTALLTVFISMGSLLLIRSILVKEGGLSQAGLFDLAWTLSGAYVMLLLKAFGTFFMPALSSIKDPEQGKVLIERVVRLSTLIMIPMISVIIVLKPLLIEILYSSEFLPSIEIVRWMLIGDYFKITCWIFGIVMIVNTDMKEYFFSELFWYSMFVSISLYSIGSDIGVEGVGVAFFISYLILCFLFLVFMKKKYGLIFKPHVFISWLCGLLMVVLTSWVTWEKDYVDGANLVIIAISSSVLVWFSLLNQEKEQVKKKVTMLMSKNYE